jgi:hypothetical protein
MTLPAVLLSTVEVSPKARDAIFSSSVTNKMVKGKLVTGRKVGTRLFRLYGLQTKSENGFGIDNNAVSNRF